MVEQVLDLTVEMPFHVKSMAIEKIYYSLKQEGEQGNFVSFFANTY